MSDSDALNLSKDHVSSLWRVCNRKSWGPLQKNDYIEVLQHCKSLLCSSLLPFFWSHHRYFVEYHSLHLPLKSCFATCDNFTNKNLNRLGQKNLATKYQNIQSYRCVISSWVQNLRAFDIHLWNYPYHLISNHVCTGLKGQWHSFVISWKPHY